ncbi:MAG: MFS transporter, partial [Actinomycetota bacterium]
MTVGVLLHLPMFIRSEGAGYRLAGMPMSPEMVLGMVLVVVGIVASLWGLFPRGAASAAPGGNIRVRALDDAPIRPAHIGLL